jgi:predicted  nucleic acid-binding Zn-ribbon protein
MIENTELSELQRRLHDAHESAARLRDTITRLEREKTSLREVVAELLRASAYPDSERNDIVVAYEKACDTAHEILANR